MSHRIVYDNCQFDVHNCRYTVQLCSQHPTLHSDFSTNEVKLNENEKKTPHMADHSKCGAVGFTIALKTNKVDALVCAANYVSVA